jgi:hypothetical protein
MKRSLQAALAAALTLGSVGGASAAITTFTNRGAFQAALGSFSVENFNSVVGEPSFRSSPLTIGSLTLQGFGGDQFGRNFIDQPPYQFSVFNIDGTTNVNAVTTPGDAGFTITFASAVRGFGADFAAFQDDAARSRIVIGGDTVIPAVNSGNIIQFLGFTSTATFTSVRFEGNIAGDGFALDNVTFGGVAAAVPEPATWAMMLIGFAGLGFASQARRRAVGV